MIGRLVKKILEVGFAAIKVDPTLVEGHFLEEMGLSAEEVATVVQLLQEKPLAVKAGYARSNEDFPMLSVVLGQEGEERNVIGDDAGMIDDEEDEDYGADLKASFWSHNYSVLVYAEHPDVCEYVYEVAKLLLLQAVTAGLFLERDAFNLKLTGAELAPDSRWMPEHLFMRRLTVSCSRSLEWLDRTGRLGTILKVGGLHIAGGAKSDPLDVKALVKPVVESKT